MKARAFTQTCPRRTPRQMPQNGLGPPPGSPSATTTTRATPPRSHLRDVLGDPTYESLARKGEAMTTAAMVRYAYDQIDQARTELEAVSK
jgi:hypothetical protein